MSDKDLMDFEYENPEEETSQTEASAVDKQESDYDTTISGIGVHYENNDNWEFDGASPTLSDDIFEKTDEENGKDESTYEETKDTASAEQDERPSKSGSNQIIINKSAILFILTGIVVAACIALISVLSVRYFTVPNGREGKYANPGSIVAVIDDTKITAGMFNYNYYSTIAYYQQYSESGLDSTQDLKSQYTTDKNGNRVSWEEFIENDVFERIRVSTVLYNRAVEAGITLTEAQEKQIKETLKTMKEKVSDGQSFNQYLESVFGKYCTEETLELVLRQYYIAANYCGYIDSQPQPDEKEINEFYDGHKNDFDMITFTFLAFEYDSTSDKTKEKSQKNIDKYMKKITDRDSIIELVPEVYADYIASDAESIMASDDTKTEKEAIEYATQNYKNSVDYTMTMSNTPFDNETTDWLFSKDTKIGDKKCYINENAGYAYVILKTEKPSADKTETYSVRHILIMPRDKDGNIDKTGEVEFTDKQWATAEKTAKKILKQYKNGDKTEYSFALLAEEFTDDEASTSAAGVDNVFGGICSGVTLGTMVPEFEDWSVDESRKYGDTGIVKSKYGYHIMFFVNHNESYRTSVIAAMRKEQLNNLVNNADIVINSKNVDRALIGYYNDSSYTSTMKDQ